MVFNTEFAKFMISQFNSDQTCSSEIHMSHLWVLVCVGVCLYVGVGVGG